MKRLQSLSYKTLFTILFFSLAGIIFFIRIGKPAQKVSAAWWDEMWHYRKAISIGNTSGSTLTNQRVKITIDTASLVTAGKLQSDCDDIRITDINGNLLDHWDTECNTANSSIYFKMASIPTTENTIYFYYGNPAANSSEKTLGSFENPGTSCQMMKNQGSVTTNGTYYIVPGGADIDKQFVYCDQTNDGGGWTLVMNQKANTGGFFTNSTQAQSYNESDPTADRYSILGKLGKFKDNGIFTFKINWPALGSTRNIWSQTSNPINETIAGYTGISINHTTSYWGGIALSSSSTSTFIDGSPGNGTWYYAIATYISYNGGIPPYAEPATNQTQLWVKGNDTMNNISISTPLTEELSPAPIAYWKFDEGVGTTVYDSAGTSNGVFGTGSSSPNWADESQCISGKCLSFDGTNDYINNGNNVSLNPNNAITIEGWFYSNNFSQVYVPFAKNLQYRIHFHNTNNLYIDFYDAAGNRLYAGYSYSSLGITNSRWYHLAFSFDGYEVKTFVNGQYKNSKTGGTGGIRSDQGGNFYIGSDSGTQYFFNGKIDDIKIYPYARTADQIKQDYNSRGSASSKGSSVNLGSNARNSVALSEGLVGYWKMDENTGTVVGDSSGVGNTGTFGIGDSAPGWTNGKYGIGISFDGVNDYINFGNPNLSSLTSASVSFWRKGPATPAGWLLFKGQSGSYYIMATSGGTGNFYHDNTGGNKIIYVDGNVVTAPPTDNNWHHYVISDVNFSSWTTLQLTNYPGWHFKGNIDEIRLYNRALSSAEVSALYNSAPGPVGYWDFNDGSGTTVIDKSGNGFNGSIAGNAVWKSGGYCKVGGCLTLDHVDDRVTVNHSSLLEPQSITIEGWVKLNSTGDRQILFTKWTGYSFEINATGYPYIRLNGVSPQDLYSSKAITWGNWHHIAATLDNNTKVTTVYLDGVNVGSTISTGNIIYNQSTLAFPYATATYANGLIDEFKIYNYTRTNKQIIEDMNAGAPATSAKSMVGYWKFDEGNGTTTYNSGNGGSVLSGSISNTTWTNDGKSNKALNFNGSNSVVSVGASMPINNEATFTGWFKVNSFNDWASVFGNFIYGGNTTPFGMNFIPFNGFIRVCSGTGSGAYVTNDFSSTDIVINKWIYGTLVYSSNQIKVYINGKMVGSANRTVNQSNTPFVIGRWATDYGGYYFSGLIDEVKIYNYALTDEEIKQDYNAGSAIQFGSTSQSIGGTTTSLEYCIPGDTSYCASPIAEYKMDEGSGTSSVDTSGNNLNTGFSGSPTWVQGKIGKALSFNGTTDYLNNTRKSLVGGLTFGVWIKTTSTDSSVVYAGNAAQNIIGDTTGSVAFGFGVHDGKVRYQHYAGAWSNVLGSTSVNDGLWHYVSVTHNSSGAIILYVDGKQDATGNIAYNGATGYNVIARGYSADHFTGQLDHFIIYNYARTPAQIAYDYNKGGPVGWWKFDECQGNIAHDWSGNQNNGTINIGSGGSQNSLGTCAVGTSAAWTNGSSGKINSSLNFDGADDYVDMGDINATDGLSSITVSVWVYSNNLNQNGMLVMKNPVNSVWELYLENNAVRWRGGGVGDLVKNLPSNNQWHNIIVTQNGTLATMYIDGVNKGSATVIALGSSSSNINIGRYGTNMYPFNGQIDDVRIYNYALTSEQIKQIYNGGAVNFK